MPGVIACNSPVPADVDLTGKQVRTAGPWQAATIEMWGGTPVTLGTAELYTALQNGTVDCMLQVYNLIDSLKLAEVAPYIYRLDFGANYNAVTMNAGTWDSLNTDDQDILLEAGTAAQEHAIELLQSEGEPLMDSIITSGGELCRPSDDVIQEKIKLAMPARDEIAAASTSEHGERLMAVSEGYLDRLIFTPEYGPTDACA